MNKLIQKLKQDTQDRNSEAWIKLNQAIDRLAEEGKDEFDPRAEIGDELWSQITILPESIAKLKKVTKLYLYGSSLNRIPPEIGEMESLQYFDPYTSYNLHWFPYEITHCKNLIDSRVSTRALYGNYKNRMPFPSLKNNPIKYHNGIKCSVCKKSILPENLNQVWITLQVATDILPLLANLCSKECESKLPKPPEDYVPFPHKGGKDLVQPQLDEWEYFEKRSIKISLPETEKEENKNKESFLIKLKRKIWGE